MASGVSDRQAVSGWAWNNLWSSELEPQTAHLPKKNIFSIFSNTASVKGSASPVVVEIDPSCIKLAQLAPDNEGQKITKIVYHPLAENENTPQQLKPILEKILRANRLRGRAIVLLPMSSMRVFSCALPSMPEPEIDQAITWKLKQSLPADVAFDSVSSDYIWQYYSRNNSAKEIRGLVFCAQRSLGQEQVQFYRKLPLELTAIQPHPYCVFLLLDWLEMIPQEENVLIISIGKDESAAIMVQGGWPCLIRQLGVSGNGFTSAIAAYHRMDRQKAEELKLNEGLVCSEGDSLCMAALSGQLESLVVELEHASRFMPGGGENTSFGRIILCGQAAALRGLDKFLSEKLSAQAALFDPLAYDRLHLGVKADPYVADNCYDFAAVLGAAVGPKQ